MKIFKTFEEFRKCYIETEEKYAEYDIEELQKDDYNPISFEEFIKINNIEL